MVRLALQRQGVLSIYLLNPIILPGFIFHIEFYENTYFSVVTETSFPSDRVNNHYEELTDTGRILSEKIFKHETALVWTLVLGFSIMIITPALLYHYGVFDEGFAGDRAVGRLDTVNLAMLDRDTGDGVASQRPHAEPLLRH